MHTLADTSGNKRLSTRISRLAFWAACFASLLFVSLAACTKTQQTGPTIYSSASSLRYATEYPAKLQALNQRFMDASSSAQEGWEQFGQFVGQLDKPQWRHTKTIYQKAQLAGRSTAVVECKRQGAVVGEFVETNGGALSQRIGAHINAQLAKEGKETPESFDARPAVRWALKDATGRQLEKQCQDLNDAYRFVTIYRDSLGRRNAKSLEKQVDIITETSFVVFVALYDLRAHMQKRLEEADDVKDTLDNEIEALQLIMEDPEGDKKKKNKANQRIAELLEIRKPIDAYAEKAQQLLDGAEEQLERIQKTYQEAFDKLIDEVEQKIAESEE